MEEEEEGYDVCGNCRFFSLLWDDGADPNGWLGLCRLKRVEWRRSFCRAHGFEPTDLHMDDFTYESLCRADTCGCGRFEEVS